MSHEKVTTTTVAARIGSIGPTVGPASTEPVAEAPARRREVLPGSGPILDLPGSAPSAGIGAAGQTAAKGVATYPIIVSPGGNVPLGFNCKRKFTATTAWPSNQVTHLVWNLMLLNKQTNQYDKVFFMGGTEVALVTDPVPATIEFEHDFSTYRDAAYTSASKTAVFVVECHYFVYFDDVAVTRSTPITLDFSAPSCVGIHSVGLSTGSIVGDGHGAEPTLTVTLDAPAPPGGQTVQLSTDNGNLGWIHGSGSFVIPAGQTSESMSWFLGTRRVYTTGRSFNIVVELVSPSGNSGKAYAKITLTKKK